MNMTRRFSLGILVALLLTVALSATAIKFLHRAPAAEDAKVAAPFLLDNAPRFEVSPAAMKRIQEVIEEMRGGYGGTLVCEPPDPVLDSPAFLAHYLRAFAQPDSRSATKLHDYDYRFRRIPPAFPGHRRR